MYLPMSCGCRVKLFNEGDRLATAERKRRLKGEYKRMNDLRWFIYWTDVGEVGYLDFQKRLKRKRLAQQMTNLELGLDADISPDKVNAMISKGIETQEKADSAAKRRRAYTSPRKTRTRPSRQSPAVRRYRLQQRGGRSTTSSGSRPESRSSSSSKSSSRKTRQHRS